jgi:hypothetical protein
VNRKARPVALFKDGVRNSLGRIFRMQIERLPLDPRAEPALQPRRPLQGDVAEGSYVVAPDDDLRNTVRL